MIISMTEEVLWDGNFCSTCLIARPLRSKHCQFVYLKILKTIFIKSILEFVINVFFDSIIIALGFFLF